MDFRGGETAALQRLRYYLWDSDLVASYFDTRNGMLGGDYSTKFAPWLALGCLSPRTVYAELKKYEQQRTANKSTYWCVIARCQLVLSHLLMPSTLSTPPLQGDLRTHLEGFFQVFCHEARHQDIFPRGRDSAVGRTVAQ